MGSSLDSLIREFPRADTLPQSRPYTNHAVTLKQVASVEQRMQELERVRLNVFSYRAGLITGTDYLSDSGTTTMTNKQWASLHLGDESYGSNEGYFYLKDQIRKLFGEQFFNEDQNLHPNAYIFHQGRAGEHALFTTLRRSIGPGKLVIPSNGHFDTTEANIESNEIEPLNLFSPELKKAGSAYHFKGDMNVTALQELFESRSSEIPLVYLTITNNTGGGQPVSMANIREVAKVAHDHGTPLFFDACRFAENAWFIQKHELGYSTKSIEEIVKEMFSYVDGFTTSFKKDGLVNMGGGVFLKEGGLFVKNYPNVPEVLRDHQILTEGHNTYGGLCGRDLMALVEGLKTIVSSEYLKSRTEQVGAFGEAMHARGIPVLTPVGGHAVYLDMVKFFEGTSMKREDFGGIAFTALLLGLYGDRACELGDFAFGKYDRTTGKYTLPENSNVRLAVPRLRYEETDLMATVAAVEALYKNRGLIPGVNVEVGDLVKTLKHFKAGFAFKPLDN